MQEDEDIDEEAEALAAKARQDVEAARLAAEKGRASENGIATAVTTDEEYVSKTWICDVRNSALAAAAACYVVYVQSALEEDTTLLMFSVISITTEMRRG